MNLRDRAWGTPPRLTAGASVLDSGLRKWVDEETAKEPPGLPSGASPFPNDVEPPLARRSWLAAMGAALVRGDRRER
ncbi:hypothetical protein LWC35_31330 [Pseudonocardia kujensis]|uniref:hypothetical protein n=1 Tax=Pseudonocardia kujensis TaxID=1128675 RepID=UPI001E3B462F|nr:hypothetical protein [Pseudonocardia kujensis]MCE0767364.1 hypothetical protein [Pseudonocardia kujensis]